MHAQDLDDDDDSEDDDVPFAELRRRRRRAEALLGSSVQQHDADHRVPLHALFNQHVVPFDEVRLPIRRRIIRQKATAVLSVHMVSVEQLDDNGRVIATFPSIKAAATAVGLASRTSISSVLSGTQTTAGGYKWRRIGRRISNSRGRRISVEQLDNNGRVIATFPSLAAASVAVGLHPHSSGIRMMLKGKRLTAGGFRWRFAMSDAGGAHGAPDATAGDTPPIRVSTPPAAAVDNELTESEDDSPATGIDGIISPFFVFSL